VDATHPRLAAASLDEGFFALLDKHLPAALELRRELHSNPRLSGDESETLESLLAHLPAATTTRLSATAALVRLGPSGRSVAIRAEMDALPIVERTGAPYAATNGAMHACGHDVHMAAFAAVFNALAESPGLPAAVVGLLQPREETFPSGALDFIESPVLHENSVVAVVGAHVQPALDSTAIAANAGTVNAASDEFRVTFRGRAAHGAYPHLSADPVVAASAFVTSVQHVVSRNVDPMLSAVVTVGSIHGGQAPNAIPSDVALSGTIRTNSVAQQAFIHSRVATVAERTADMHGCTAEVDFTFGDPPLVNDTRLAHAAAQILTERGLDTSGEFRSYGADDFAFYGRHAPTLMVFVGTEQSNGGLHSDGYLPGDDAVRRVAYAMMAGYLAGASLTAGDPLSEELHALKGDGIVPEHNGSHA
jgi:amidohydrolase